jgi:hypothetical protein
MIDYGGTEIVHQNDMYYMHKTVMNDCSALSIRASLCNVEEPVNNREYNKLHDYAKDIIYTNEELHLVTFVHMLVEVSLSILTF